MTGFNQLGQAPWGPVLFNRNDRNLGAALRDFGEYSEGELEVLRQLVPRNGLVIDVGANIGAIAVPLALHVGIEGVVIAMEPQRVVYQTLCANAALNSLENVIALNVASGRAPGRIKVPRMDLTGKDISPGSMSLLARTADAAKAFEMVTVLPLDAMNLTRLDLLKVDVEGMELDVIAGAVDTIGKFRPSIYVENDREEFSADLIGIIESLGYQLWWHMPFMVREEVGHLAEGLASLVSLNMLCLPKEDMNVIHLEPVAGQSDGPKAAMQRIMDRGKVAA